MASVEEGLGSRFYVPKLDMLRFCAFAMVFVNHSFPVDPSVYEAKGVAGWLSKIVVSIVFSGRLGVDLFFVISSYLITHLLVAEVAKSGYLDIKAFYIRRALRIWPLYFSFLIIGFVVQRVLGLSAIDDTSFVAFLAFMGNWQEAAHPGTIDTSFGILWSVCVEEQFYLLWPLLITLCGVPNMSRIALGMIALSVTARLVYAFAGEPYTAMWFATVTHLDPIAMGALLALHPVSRALGSWLWFVIAIVAFPATSYANFSAPYFAPVVTFTINALVCAGLVASVLRGRGKAQQSLAGNALVYLGKISFGLYVFHATMINISLVLYPSKVTIVQIARIGCAFGITVIAAILSYEMMEKPFLRMKERFSRVLSRPA